MGREVFFGELHQLHVPENVEVGFDGVRGDRFSAFENAARGGIDAGGGTLDRGFAAEAVEQHQRERGRAFVARHRLALGGGLVEAPLRPGASGDVEARKVETALLFEFVILSAPVGFRFVDRREGGDSPFHRLDHGFGVRRSGHPGKGGDAEKQNGKLRRRFTKNHETSPLGGVTL